MSARYAASTEVAAERSRVDLERLLRRYGADQFVTGWERGRAVLGFRLAGHAVRIEVPMPTEADAERTETGKLRNAGARDAALRQLERQRWRALLLLTQAKLEAVELGLETLEQAFLSHLVLPDQRTVSEALAGQVEQWIKDGQVPRLLPGAGP